MVCRWVLFFWCIGGCVAPLRAAGASEGKDVRDVLVLNSYSPGYVWSDWKTKGIRKVLDAEGSSVRLSFEYMDTKRYKPSEIFDTLKEVYRLKYASVSFDVIIASDNNALDFLLLYRAALFPGVPVVFCGVNDFSRAMLKGQTGYTGIAEDYDLKGTLDLALAIHPETTHVAYISGGGTSSHIIRDQFESLIPGYASRVEFIRLSMMSPDDLKKALADLPEHTVILYLSYYVTPDGTRFTVAEGLSLIFEAARKPIYGIWDYTLGNGALGGRMLRVQEQASEAARMALKVLDGTPVDDLPVMRESFLDPIFDYTMLDYFDISMGRLPEGSVVINEPVTVYYRYKYVIWATVLFLIYQSVTIVVLMRIIARRKRAEEREKALEAQLRQAHKMEAMGTFAGGIAHDFNNILGGIATCTELAADEVEDKSPVQEDLSQVLKAVNRGKSLVRQILTFSQNKDREMQPVQMRLILMECTQLLKSSIPSTIDVRLNVQAEAGFVLADPTQIHQVIMNLCTNASHAVANQKGCIEIALEAVELDRKASLRHPDLHKGRYSRLTVRDNGQGIAPENMERIFDPFFSTRKESGGTGLGLSMSHGIVKNHGGAITVASHPGRGTIFSVFIPCAHGVATVPGETTAAPNVHTQGTVMLVDDDEQMLYGTEKLLTRMGYEVAAFSGSLEALKAFRTDPVRYDLVFTDHMMPFLNGIELAAELLTLRSDIPVVLCTGYQDELQALTPDVLEQNGISEVLSKPFKRRELETILPGLCKANSL